MSCNSSCILLMAIVIALSALAMLTYSQIGICVGIGPDDYGYEFPVMQINGINSTITYYNISTTSQIPSVQQNVCLSINDSPIFVQNVLWYYGEDFHPGWGISIFYDGSYHIVSTELEMTGNTYVLTMVWQNNGSGVVIDFCLSNITWKDDISKYVPGVYGGVVGTNSGTVVVGYGNGSTAYFAPGFNVSISSEIKVNDKWYVPPAIFSGFPNTGESAVYGRAYLAPRNTVFVVYNNTRNMLYEPQILALPSLIISGNKVLVFPFNSLWVIKYPNGTSSIFVNQTEYVEGAEVYPYGNFSLPYDNLLPNVTQFKLQKLYHVVSEVRIYGSNNFWVPQEEYVFTLINGSYEPILINGSTSKNITTTTSSTSTLTSSTNASILTLTVTKTITETVTQTKTIVLPDETFITLHEVTTVVTTVIQSDYFKKFYELVAAVVIAEVIILLIFRKKDGKNT
ncbi:hypothetical protein HS7_02240 [Sulfolobales archaeon HS-7]|nr:hypothetical protein HS7_02240 [Sulfolobales archaeon HS-7]